MDENFFNELEIFRYQMSLNFKKMDEKCDNIVQAFITISRNFESNADKIDKHLEKIEKYIESIYKEEIEK